MIRYKSKIEMPHKKFGQWTVLSYSHSDATKSPYFKCRCSCGKESTVEGHALRSGKSMRCVECGHKEKGKKKFVHGKCYNRVYNSWSNMLSRCRNPANPSWHLYGGVGITVCDSWKKFKKFYEDMGNRPEGKTLCRLDIKKSYSKDNCRWGLPLKNKKEGPL